MNRINTTLKKLENKNQKAFVAYLMSGEESIEKTKKDVLVLEKMGTDIIELGVPFSDPAADGVVIQEAGKKALKNNVSIKDVLSLVQSIREVSQIPIVIMTYLNPILSLGVEEFFHLSAIVGVDGVIIPDVPLEESNFIIKEANKKDISFIPLATLSSSKERIQSIVSIATSFVYCVNTMSVTGGGGKISDDTIRLLNSVSVISPVPVLSGFGISNSSQARNIKEHCMGVIVGSHIINLINQNKYSDIEELIKSVKE